MIFTPDFSKYDLVISNFGWNAAHWPAVTQKNFEKFIADGGGLVVFHAADNSLSGKCGIHDPQSEYQIQVRNLQHPTTKGMPKLWMHTKDELYNRLREPAENMNIIATAYSEPSNKETGRHEPALMV